MRHSLFIAVLLISSLSISGCTQNTAYRTHYQPCVISEPSENCTLASLQEYTDPADPELNYALGFVEFDDQGQLYDRRQMHALIDFLYQAASEDDLLITVFVHGWHHSARPLDDNIVNFRKTLLNLSKLETTDARDKQREPRRIMGVYVGWRGESVDLPQINKLSFWDRKSTAQLVGQRGVVELFSRLEEVRNIKENLSNESLAEESSLPQDPLPQDQRPQDQRIKNRLIIVGHSFGGAVVYSSLSQIMMDRFVDTRGPVGVSSSIDGFGDFVVLINPAFEALQFATLSDMANERRTYFPDQAPVMAVMTSEADYATKYAFPIGRWFSTAFDEHRNVSRTNAASGQEQVISQGSADRTALGHFEPFITHRLNPNGQVSDMAMLPMLESVRKSWREDSPNSEILFPGSILEHLNKSVSRNPYLVIQVDKDIIPSHNEIYDPRVVDFLSYLIMTSVTEE